MRHCIIMTAYKDVEMINRFISLTPEDWGIYIHIDLKSKIDISDIDPRANVFSLKRVYWGGWEHLYVFWRLLNEARKSGINYDYFHLISGQDFYACPPSSFDTILGAEKMSYMGLFQIPNRYWNWEGGYKIFKYSYCADELFVQTILYNSEFYKNVVSLKNDDYMSIKRFIDWNRGQPYTFKLEDFDLIMNSGCFFARKFSSKVDKNIIDKIYEKGMKDNGES